MTTKLPCVKVGKKQTHKYLPGNVPLGRFAMWHCMLDRNTECCSQTTHACDAVPIGVPPSVSLNHLSRIGGHHMWIVISIPDSPEPPYNKLRSAENHYSLPVFECYFLIILIQDLQCAAFSQMVAIQVATNCIYLQ